MIDKLQELILHFEDLEKQMIDPNLINDQNKYKEVTREHRRLIPIIDKSKQYISIHNQISEDESMPVPSSTMVNSTNASSSRFCLGGTFFFHFFLFLL